VREPCQACVWPFLILPDRIVGKIYLANMPSFEVQVMFPAGPLIGLTPLRESRSKALRLVAVVRTCRKRYGTHDFAKPSRSGKAGTFVNEAAERRFIGCLGKIPAGLETQPLGNALHSCSRLLLGADTSLRSLISPTPISTSQLRGTPRLVHPCLGAALHGVYLPSHAVELPSPDVLTLTAAQCRQVIIAGTFSAVFCTRSGSQNTGFRG